MCHLDVRQSLKVANGLIGFRNWTKRKQTRRQQWLRLFQKTTQHDTQPLKTEDRNSTEDSSTLSRHYTPEFGTYLRQLDEESGVRTVVDRAPRDQQLREMSRVISPDNE